MDADNQPEVKGNLMYKIRWAQSLGGVGARFPESEPFSAENDAEAERTAQGLDRKVASGYLGYLHADLYCWNKDRESWIYVKSLY